MTHKFLRPRAVLLNHRIITARYGRGCPLVVPGPSAEPSSARPIGDYGETFGV